MSKTINKSARLCQRGVDGSQGCGHEKGWLIDGRCGRPVGQLSNLCAHECDFTEPVEPPVELMTGVAYDGAWQPIDGPQPVRSERHAFQSTIIPSDKCAVTVGKDEHDFPILCGQPATAQVHALLDVECQFCEFKGSFAEGRKHRRTTQHLLRTWQGQPRVPAARKGFLCDRCGEYIARPRATEVDTCIPCREEIDAAMRPATEPVSQPPGELLPCPFCRNTSPRNGMMKTGLKVKRDPVAYLEPSTWIVLCLDCGAIGANHNSEQEAIEAWNTRTTYTPASEAAPDEDGLPAIGGRALTEWTVAEFERNCRILIRDEQEKPNCDTHLIAVLCNAVRVAREQTDLATSKLPRFGQ